MYDAGVAMNGLSCFMTPDLARDLANDIMTLVSNLCSSVLDSTPVISITDNRIIHLIQWFSTWAIKTPVGDRAAQGAKKNGRGNRGATKQLSKISMHQCT